MGMILGNDDLRSSDTIPAYCLLFCVNNLPAMCTKFNHYYHLQH